MYKTMGSGNNETGKEITRSFDIDAAVVDTIYGTRGRIKSACLLLACPDQIPNYHDRYILLKVFYDIREDLGVSPSWGAELIGIFYIPVTDLPSLIAGSFC